MTVVLPCSMTGIKVLPEGDHIKANFAPKGSGASGDRPMTTGAPGTRGRGGIPLVSTAGKVGLF